MFPDFGFGLAPKVLRYKLARRISDIKRKNADDIEICRQKAKVSVQYTLQANPMAHLPVRLRAQQQLWDKTPFKELVRINKGSDGKEYPVYEYNVRERIKILKAFERELGGVDGVFMRVDKNGNKTEISAEEAYAEIRQAQIEALDVDRLMSIDADGNVYEVASGECEDSASTDLV